MDILGQIRAPGIDLLYSTLYGGTTINQAMMEVINSQSESTMIDVGVLG
jgi:hypothetical protein